MEKALPEESESRLLPTPNGIVSVKIDPETGLRTAPTDPDGIFEIFREELVPAEKAGGKASEDADLTQQIF